MDDSPRSGQDLENGHAQPLTRSPGAIMTLLRVLLLWSAGLCAAAQFAKFSLTLDVLAERYPETGTGLGYLVSLISVLGVLLGLMIGALIARIGARTALLGGLMIGLSISAWQSTLPAFHWLLASRILEGISHLLIVVACPTLLSLHTRGKARSLALTLWSTFFGVAFALFAMLTPAVITEHGLSGLLQGHALTMAVITALLAGTLPTRNTRHADESLATSQPRIWATVRAWPSMHVSAYCTASIATPALAWLFYTLTYVALLTVLPQALPSPLRQTLALALPLVSIASALTLGSLLLSRCSPTVVVLAGFIIATLSSVALLAEPLLPLAAMTLFAAFGLIQAGNFASIPVLNHTAESISLANGGIAQMGNLGNTIGTPAMLLLFTSAGLPGIALGLVVCYTLAIGVHACLLRRLG